MRQTISANIVSIRNIDLASTLLSLHFKLRHEEPISILIDEHKRKTFIAHFVPETIHDVFGPISVRQIIAILKDDQAVRQKARADLVECVDHMRAKETNRNTLLDIIRPKNEGGRGLVRPKATFPVGEGWRASLPIDASEELQNRFWDMVQKVT